MTFNELLATQNVNLARNIELDFFCDFQTLCLGLCNAPILEDVKISDEELMDTSVAARWPFVDFMCFQEVWDRYFTAKLIRSLHPKFKYFVVDVAKQGWKSNMYWGSK